MLTCVWVILLTILSVVAYGAGYRDGRYRRMQEYKATQEPNTKSDALTYYQMWCRATESEDEYDRLSSEILGKLSTAFPGLTFSLVDHNGEPLIECRGETTCSAQDEVWGAIFEAEQEYPAMAPIGCVFLDN